MDYRIPVYCELNRLCEDHLTVIYNADIVPHRCQQLLKSILNNRAIGLTGEIRIGGQKIENQTFANQSGYRFTIRPGLIRQILRTRPDVILSDGFFLWTYSALLINMFWRVPHVMCYERTMHTERNISKIKDKARHLVSRYINNICCNGIQTKDYLIHFGFPESRLFLGNMASDTKALQEKLALINRPTLAAQIKMIHNITGPVFLYVGQLIPRKGIMQLLYAWKHFTDNIPEPTLVLIGGGEQEEEAIEFIRTQAIRQVRLLGKVEYSEIVRYYAMADIFIIATLEDNWSLVVPEAMSCGLPVICSKYNGCWPELVRPENGWVFDPLDKIDFAKTLQKAWKERAEWKTMGQQSLKIVQDFTPEKTALNIYNACESSLIK